MVVAKWLMCLFRLFLLKNEAQSKSLLNIWDLGFLPLLPLSLYFLVREHSPPFFPFAWLILYLLSYPTHKLHPPNNFSPIFQLIVSVEFLQLALLLNFNEYLKCDHMFLVLFNMNSLSWHNTIIIQINALLSRALGYSFTVSLCRGTGFCGETYQSRTLKRLSFLIIKISWNCLLTKSLTVSLTIIYRSFF